MNGLLQSRKFWITMVDLIVSTATYFIGKYVNPASGADILWLIAAWQPVILILINSIAKEDVADKMAMSNEAIAECKEVK
jgi:hypothetical protein